MLDYRPDLDPTTPGLLTDIMDMIPTERGYRVATVPVAATAHTLTLGASESAISCLYATRWLTQPGGILIAGTDKDLYVYDFTNGFIKVSKAGGYSLVGSTYQYGEDTSAAFDICSFGDVLIAAHQSIVPQYRSALDRTIATLFADLGTTVTAPKAAVCAVASNFVFLGNLHSTWGSGTTVAGTPDMVAWSAIGDHQNWAINPLSTQGSYQQFVDTPGPITALCRLNDGIVVFKASSMYFGRYVGSGTNSPIWDFERISDRVGCIGHRSVIDIGGRLVFVGLEDAFIFDGTQPRPITHGLWQSQFRNVTNSGGIFPMWVGHDRINNCVLIRNVTGSASLVWSYRYDKWSVIRSSNNGGDVTSGGYNGVEVYCKTNVNDFRVTTTTQTSGTLNTDHYDLYTMFATSSAQTLNVATACKCYTRRSDNPNFTASGVAYSSLAYVTTGAIGNDENVTKFTRVSPKAAGKNGSTHGITTATIRMDYKSSLGDAWTTGGSTTALDTRRRFDLLALGTTAVNWASFKISITDQLGGELIDIGIDPKPAGKR